MTVTSIVPLDKRRSKVFLEEDFAFVLYKGELQRYRIEEGADLREEQYREIMTRVLPKRAIERAVNLLKNTDKTELELRRKLREGFYPEPVIDAAVRKLTEYHFVDDSRYAARYIELRGGRKSRRQLSCELEQKGISREMISELLEQYPVEEEEQIRAFLEKKHFDYVETEARERSKLAASLGRKGYSFDAIRHVMESMRLL